MHEAVQAKQDEIAELCRRLGVRRLDIFGSATGDQFDVSTSDVDVLVQFETGRPFDYFDSYFELKDGLERIFARPADIVFANRLDNPYFRDPVMNTRELMYAA
jgi:predicted nucleotidyltransferase